MLRLFGSPGSAGPRPSGPPPVLPVLSQQDIEHLLGTRNGLPFVDWGFADAWARERFPDADSGNIGVYQRAVAAAWLDALTYALPEAHRRWRTERVEGVAPMTRASGRALAPAAERSLEVLTRDLRPLRGVAPIPPVAVVGIAPTSSYIDFTDHFHSPDGGSGFEDDEASYATSGGVYINQGTDAFPLLAVSVIDGSDSAAVVAHELTHHALHGMSLPPWAEEGLAQMMEERVTGVGNFQLDHEQVERHREHLGTCGTDRFIDGIAFHSPEADEQELAYHLAQWVVRSLLESRPTDFFAFARACRDSDSAEACVTHLGSSPHDLITKLISGGRTGD